MKFLCPSCKAKYQIADEKVAGRSVRMKCRKCGHVIQVTSADAVASSSAPPPDVELDKEIAEAAPAVSAPKVPVVAPGAAPSAEKSKPAMLPSRGAKAPVPTPSKQTLPLGQMPPTAGAAAAAAAATPGPGPAKPRL